MPQNATLDLSAGFVEKPQPVPRSPQWADVAKPGPYFTRLAPDEEQNFQSWVKSNNVPWRDAPSADYDMRGFWKGLQSGDPTAKTAINPVDHKIHYPDKWKTPYHETFSNESQYATPDAGHWEGNTFVPPATRKTATPIDLSAGFVEHQKPQGLSAPPPGTAEALHRSNQAVRAFSLENPPPTGLAGPIGQAAAREGMLGVASGFGIPETQHPVRDLLSGLYQTLVSPPTEAEAPVGNIPVIGQPLVALNRLAGGAARGVYENVSQGVPEAAQGFERYIHAPTGDEAAQAEAMGHLTHGMGRAAAGLVPLGEAAKGVVGALPSPAEGFRSTTRRLVGASPGEVAEASAKAGERATGVAEKNAAATAKASLANQTDISQAQADFNRALADWEEENRAGSEGIAQKRLEQQNAYQEKLNKVRASNQRARDLQTQLHKQAAEFGETHGQHFEELQEEARAAYPKVKGEIEDTGEIADNVESAVTDKLKEYTGGQLPTAIRQIVDRLRPQDAEAIVDSEGGALPPATQRSGYEVSAAGNRQPIAGWIGEPPGGEEAAGAVGEAATKANFENLQSMRSRVMALARKARLSGDRVLERAYLTTAEQIDPFMERLAEADNKTEEFAAAQKNYAKLMDTFVNRKPSAAGGAPLRDVLSAVDKMSGEPLPAQILSVLKRPGAIDSAIRMLSRYGDTPALQQLTALRDTLAETGKLPRNAGNIPEPEAPKMVPDYEPKPRPVLESPVPAHTATLEPPPEPFNKSEFVKGKLTEKGRQMQHLSPFEVGAPAAAAIGLMRYGPEAALAPLAYPVARYGLGRLLEHPGFQEWVAREPGESLAQPGTPGLRGNPTPFNNPPPPSSPQTGPSTPSGAGPSTPEPPVSLRDAVMGSIEASDKVSRLMQQIRGLGDRMPAERARLEAQLRTAMQEANIAERRLSDAGPPAGVAERRGGRMTPTATMEVPPEVGAKIKAAGLLSKGEVVPGSGVFQVEHPDFPGKTFTIKATDMPADIARKLQAMRDRFGK